MLKRRIINIRVMFATFCGLMVGILFPYLLIKNIANLTSLLVISFALLLVVIGLWLYAHFTHKYNLTIEYREKVSILIKGACIGFIGAFIVGIIIMCRPILMLHNVIDYGDTNVKVEGTVSDYVQSDATYQKFLVDNCIITDSGISKQPDFKICVYTTKFIDVDLGDKVSFEGILESFEVKKDSDFAKLIQNIGYSTFVNQIETIDGLNSLKDTIKQATKDVLDDNLNSDNSSIFYAILFGDKQGLSNNLSQMFSYAGISHILAVSGLHIGVLVSLIYFALKRIKINRWARIAILGAILLFYTYLCSFTPSVCRASIMAMIAALCDAFMIENDSLSSLSISGILILFISPLSLFSISFQLSFLCVFAIISLAPTITKLFRKIKTPKFLSSALAISIATNLAILPVCLNSFTEVSLLGILSNIVVLPLFSIAYVLLFVIVVISLILPMGALLALPNLFLQLIKTIANYVASIDFGIFKVFNISYWALFLVVLVSLIIHFLMVKFTIKGSLSALLISVLTIMIVISAIPNNYSGNNMVFGLKYNSNLCYYVKDNEVTLIGSDIEERLLMSEAKKLKIAKITNVIAYDLQLNDLDNLISYCEKFGVENVYIPSNFDYPEIKQKIKSAWFCSNDISIGDLTLTPINLNGQVIAVDIAIDDIGRILIPEIKPTKAEAKYLEDTYAGMVDYIYVNNPNTNLTLSKFGCKVIMNETNSEKYINLENAENYILNKNSGE